MKKLFWISIGIAVLAAFFASTHPDGLDFVSERFNFAEKGQAHTAPLADYSVNFLPAGSISTSIAGIAGVLIVWLLFWFAIYLLKKRTGKTDKNFLIFLIALIIYPSPAFAARPLVTDDFYTVSQGGYELEFGYGTTQNQAAMANVAGLSFKRGFLPQFDLGIEVPYTTSTPSGLNDVLLHAKYRLWQRGEDEGLTGRVDYKFNNGEMSQGLGSGDNDF
ncbi:MAG: PDGLE domain-containing protein, partial [Candidatus Margulisiibacteriota bacterium]